LEYRFLAFDIMSRELRAELPLIGVQFSWTAGGAGTFTGTIDRYSPQATRKVLDPQRTYIAVERNGKIVWCGILWAPAKTDDTITVAATEVVSIFAHRYIRERLFYAAQDKGYIARALINYGQTGLGGALGITTGAETVGQTVSVGYNFWDKKKILDAISELAAVDAVSGGFDFIVEPSWGVSNNLALAFRIYFPRRGRLTTYVLEYGSNIDSYGWSMVSPAYNWLDALGDGSENALRRASASSTAVLANTPRIEGIIDASTIKDQALLQAIAASALKDLGLVSDRPSVHLMEHASPAVGDVMPSDVVQVRIDDGFVQVNDNFVIDEITVDVTGDTETQSMTFVFDDALGSES
jgi:hypothetical protein